MKSTKRKLALLNDDDYEEVDEVKSHKMNNITVNIEAESEDDDDGAKTLLFSIGIWAIYMVFILPSFFYGVLYHVSRVCFSDTKDDDLDEFEYDGFIFDDYEKEEEDQDGKAKQKEKKKKKRKPLKDFVLDDDDLELLQENKISGLPWTNSVGNEKFKWLKKGDTTTESTAISRISDDDKEEAMSNDEEDEMADFIVYDEIRCQVGGQSRQLQLREEKMSKQVTVASSSVLEEADYLFGDIDEIINLHVVKIVRPDNFDENELDNYTIDRDDQIKESDVPERMQIFEEIAGPAPVDEMSREEESSWILNQLAGNMCLLYIIRGTDQLKKISKGDIIRFLELRHLEKYDIPFIAMYRKEKCRSLLEDSEEDGIEDDNVSWGKLRLKWHKVLWAINELDKKWLLIQKRKSALQKYYNKCQEDECFDVDDVEKLSLLKQQFDRITRVLKSAETERDIDDVDSKFSLHFPPPGKGMTRKFKQPNMRSEYNKCSEAGLWKLTGKFGCSSEQFGLHLSLEKVGMEFGEDPAEPPEAIALDFICPMFETPESVLNGARLMAAMEISSEPYVRKHVRGIFMDKAVVSTCPTPEGDKAIDSLHLFYGVKWLSDKPIDKFQKAQWLLIQKAEEDKLLQVTISLPETILNKLVTEFHEIYLARSGDMSAQLWDEQRKLIIRDAFSNFLLPSLEKEARALLTTRAKNWLLMEYGKQLWKRASIAPYQQKKNIAGQEEVIAPKVMACCWGPGNPPIAFVMLESSGQLLDVLQAKSLCMRSQNVIDQQRKKYDQLCVLKFIVNHRPSVIVVGAHDMACTWLKENIEEIILKIEEDPTVDDQVMNKINIVYGDESFAQLYESSKISSCQLPGQEGIVRRAVALGRYLQNPLAMIAMLSGPQKEVLSWRLKSLDHFLTPDEKYEMIEMVLVDVTNQVGIDVNFTVHHDWLFGPLQFVSGLGPHKAAFLQRELMGSKTCSHRYDLAGCGLRPKKIFNNAVGFLRVHCSQPLSAPSEFALLDDTRIHPESYILTERLAKAVVDDIDQTQPILYIKENPQLLNNFNIDDFADNYEIEHGENKRETLHAIKNELLHGFLDPRNSYVHLTQDEVFFLISGKNEDTFAEGRIIQVTVRRVLSQRAFCTLDYGLTGVIMKEDYMDGSDDFSLKDMLHEGDSLACKIKQLEKSRYQVLLTRKESELKSCRNQNFHEVDPYYCEGKKSLLIQQDEAHKNELAKKLFTQRIIDHPNFKNITKDQAIEFLFDKDVGENIFHPSSRGYNYLTLTLKVYDGLFVQKDIIEAEKDSKGITSLLHLGKSLKIGDCIYKDLDELMDQYVNPLLSHLKAMISFQKFKKGSKAEVGELLRAEKSEYPKRIVYCFGLSYEHPGTFILSYMRTNLCHEYIGLYPEGFKFRKQIFAKVEQVVEYFQSHIDDLRHGLAATGNLPSSYSSGAPMGIVSIGGWQRQLVSRRDGSSATDFGGRKGYSIDRGGGKGHPSGLPRPNGERGRGHGNGRSIGDMKAEDFGCSNDGYNHAVKKTFSAGWDSRDKGNSNRETWGKSFGGSSGGWDKKDNTWSTSCRTWGRSEGSGTGGDDTGVWIDGDKGSSGRGRADEWSGNQGGNDCCRQGYGGRRRYGRNFGNGRQGDNDSSGSDFGYNTSNWGKSTKDACGDSNRTSTFCGGGNWGVGSDDSWGGNGSSENTSGKSNVRGSTQNESRGILGSGPTPFGKKESQDGWGNVNSSGGSGGRFNF